MPSPSIPPVTPLLNPVPSLPLLKLCTQPISFKQFFSPNRSYIRRTPQRLKLDKHFGLYDTRLPGGIGSLFRWWRRLRPLKVELRDLRRRIILGRWGFDHIAGKLTRYFVRFPFLTDEEFSSWRVTCDRDLDLGYSWAEFIRIPPSAPGHAVSPDSSSYFSAVEHAAQLPTSREDDHLHPFAYTYPAVHAKLGPYPGGKVAASDALVASVSDVHFKGFGVFRGFLSTRVPDRGDLVRAGFANLSSPESTLFGFILPYALYSHTHLIIRYRGDGRSYRINITSRQMWDATWNDTHHFVLYTRGGPYWQVAKIPFSKFFILRKGLIRTRQHKLPDHSVRLISFTLMDDVDGPFCLELDYIALYCDTNHREKFAYEQYDQSGLMK